VGIVIADSDPAYLNDPFISRLVSGLSNYLSSIDYTLDVQGVAPERFENRDHSQQGGQRRAVRDSLRTEEPAAGALLLSESPRSAHGRFPRGIQVSRANIAVVSQDDLSGGKQLGRHLLKKRLRSVIFVRPALSWSAVEQREKGSGASSATRLPRSTSRL